MSQDHFDPATYHDWVRAEIPSYEHLQESIAAATSDISASTVLDLGTGTGETLDRVLALHPSARAVGVDESEKMLDVARARLQDREVELRVADLLEPLPPGPFDLVVSALAIHHLDGPGKAELFGRVANVLRPGGRFVLGDVVVPADAEAGVIAIIEGWDKPSSVAEQVAWMEQAGLVATVVWEEDDLALFTADRLGPGH